MEDLASMDGPRGGKQCNWKARQEKAFGRPPLSVLDLVHSIQLGGSLLLVLCLPILLIPQMIDCHQSIWFLEVGLSE